MISTHARLATLVVLWSGLTTALLLPGRAGCSVWDDSAASAASNHDVSPQLDAADLVQLIVLYVASGTGTRPTDNTGEDPTEDTSGDPPPTGDPSGEGDPVDDPEDPGDPNDPGAPTHHNPEPATLVSGAIGAGLLMLSRWRKRRQAVTE